MEHDDCCPINVDELSGPVKFAVEITKVLDVLAKQPYGKGRKRLTKQDVSDVQHGKIASDFKIDLTVSPPNIRPVVPKAHHLKPGKTNLHARAGPSSVTTSTSSSAGGSAERDRRISVKPCPFCKSRRFRVVDPGRPDGKRILECARRDCLASIRFTTHPEGMMIGDTLEEGSYGWYLKDPGSIFYPRASVDKNYTFGRANKTEELRDESGRLCIRCPGQKKLVVVL